MHRQLTAKSIVDKESYESIIIGPPLNSVCSNGLRPALLLCTTDYGACMRPSSIVVVEMIDLVSGDEAVAVGNAGFCFRPAPGPP